MILWISFGSDRKMTSRSEHTESWKPKGESKAGKKEARDGFMVVPGVAFDADKNRIGFGGGYYDKYLELYPELFTAAVAFGFQIVEGVPIEANDIRPQKLITEERIYE